MSFIKPALTVLKRILIVVGIAIAFSIGLLGAIILSLYSSQTKVPDIVGKDRATAEDVISAARLNFRVRAIRPVSDAKPNTVIIQIPSAGQEVKVGQTVAVDISRPTKEGEQSSVADSNSNTNSDSTAKHENNSSSETNSNENNRKRKSSNKNANSNENQNGNANANRATNKNKNLNLNVNRPTNGNTNTNAGPAIHNNQNSNQRNGTANRVNTNANRPRPAATPKTP